MCSVPHDSQSLDHAPSESAEARGGDLRVSLACPKCDRAGWISWKNLGRSMRCPVCSCHFQIGRLGKLELRSNTPRVRYECPRCRQSVELPATLAVRGVECTACQLMLVVGPDQRLHSEQEAAQLRIQQRKDGGVSKPGLFGKSGSMSRATLLSYLLLASLALILGSVALGFLSGSSGKAPVEDFTSECLAGAWKDALEYVGKDPIQAAEFERWRMTYFSSLLNKHRPANDRMKIQPELLEQTSELGTYRVTLSSPLVGKRAHEQIWRKSATGHWQFDARATLAKLDVHAKPAGDAQASQPVVPGRRISLPGQQGKAPDQRITLPGQQGKAPDQRITLPGQQGKVPGGPRITLPGQQRRVPGPRNSVSGEQGKVPGRAKPLRPQ